MLWLLDMYGFKANVEQAPETIRGIKYMMSFVPAVAAVVSGLVMVIYPLSDQKMREILVDLEERRKEEQE